MPLPYDMGNAGDLVKHGLLAEFTEWWCRHEKRPLRFLDPFAGQPWISPPKKDITRRVEALRHCAINNAQPESTIRYYGSSYVVLNVAKAAGCSSAVYVSDSNSTALDAFQDPAIKRLECPGFSGSDGFSILEAEFEGDLLLLDPFADFLPRRAVEIIPKMASASQRIAVVVFVLNLNPENRVGQQYRQLRSQHLAAAWCLNCPKLPQREIAGESRYEVDVLLAWRGLTEHPGRNELRNQIDRYARCLSGVLGTEVTFAGN